MAFHIASILLPIAVSASTLQPQDGDSLIALSRTLSSQQVSAREAEHRVMKQLANTHKPTAGLVLSLKQLAADVVARQENCSEDLVSVIDPVLNETSLVIDTELNASTHYQADINEAYDRVVGCNMRLQPADAAALYVDADREIHGTCRTQQQQLSHTDDAMCDDFEAFRAGTNYPSCMYKSGGGRADVTGDCMLTLSTWLNMHHDTFLQKESACDEAEQNHETKQASCNLKQHSFETAYCVWAGEAEWGYNSYTSCYSQESAAYNSTVAAVKAVHAASVDEYVAAMLTHCLLLFLRDNPSMADQTHLAECDQVDTSVLDITYPDLPAKVSVALPTSRPCEDAWLQAEYMSKTWYSASPTTTCVACSQGVEAQAFDESACVAHCQNQGFCCNDPDIGSNQFLSCSQACKVRAGGSSQADCSAACDMDRSCTRQIGGLTFGMCSTCSDLTDQCPHGVQSVSECHTGCDFAPA